MNKKIHPLQNGLHAKDVSLALGTYYKYNPPESDGWKWANAVLDNQHVPNKPFA